MTANEFAYVANELIQTGWLLVLTFWVGNHIGGRRR